MHSQGYIARSDNPVFKCKSEAEHIEHFTSRAQERFGLTLTIEDYYDLLYRVGKGIKSAYIYSINSSNSIHQVELWGAKLWVIHGNSGDRISSRLKTALIPSKGFIVPDCLSRKYNHQIFTEAVYKTLEEFKLLSEELDLSNKRVFFERDINSILKRGALEYKKHENLDSVFPISMAVRYLINNKNEA